MGWTDFVAYCNYFRGYTLFVVDYLDIASSGVQLLVIQKLQRVVDKYLLVVMGLYTFVVDQQQNDCNSEQVDYNMMKKSSDNYTVLLQFVVYSQKLVPGGLELNLLDCM